MDDASHKMGVGVDLQLKPPTEERIERATQLDFPAFNNETEYEVILAEIDHTKFVYSEILFIRSDSQLVVG